MFCDILSPGTELVEPSVGFPCSEPGVEKISEGSPWLISGYLDVPGGDDVTDSSGTSRIMSESPY